MVLKLFHKSKKVLSSEQQTIISAAAVIGSIYAFSAFLGFIRNRLLSGYFGDSTELGIFFAADSIPTLIFSLIVSGSLSAAFIPIFTKYYKRNKEEAWRLASGVLNVSLIILLIFALVVFFGADFIAVEILGRNTNLSQEEFDLMASLMRIMMVAQIALIISSIFTSILQSFNRFVIPALAPVFYNLGVILFLILFIGRFGIYAPAYGMIFGSILHLLLQIPFVTNLGYRYRKTIRAEGKGVLLVYKLMIPRTIGQAAQKLLIPLYTNLALFISAPSNVILTFAFTIQSLPVRVLGMSIGQAALPILSKVYDEDDKSSFSRLLMQTVHQVIYLVLPISILFLVLRVPLVRLAVGSSKYSWEATLMTAYTLGFFSISLVPQSLSMILARGFYAMSNTKTPVIVGLFTVFINATSAILFVKYFEWGVWSLGLAYAISAFIDAGILGILIYREVGAFDLGKVLGPINKMLIASFLMGIFLYIPLKVLDQLIFDTTRTFWLLVLTGIVTIIGFIAYIFFSKLLNIKEIDIFYNAFKKMTSELKINNRFFLKET